LRLIETATYRGPHLWSRLPMIRLKVDLGPLEDYPTTKLEGFTAELTRLLPGLAGHGCSYHQPGGFLRRLEDGTWLGHVVEHVALELQTTAGAPATRGKTRSVRGQPGVYNILFAYEDETVGLEAGLTALRLVDSLLPEDLRGLQGIPEADGAFGLDKAMTALKALVRKSALGPTTASLVAEARRRDIPVARLNDQSLIRLGWGAKAQIIRASITGRTSLVATETAGDKNLAKTLLQQGACPRRGGWWCAPPPPPSSVRRVSADPWWSNRSTATTGAASASISPRRRRWPGPSSRRSNTAAGSSSRSSTRAATIASSSSADRSRRSPSVSPPK
jgi:cyanophycin synthetase